LGIWLEGNAQRKGVDLANFLHRSGEVSAEDLPQIVADLV